LGKLLDSIEEPRSPQKERKKDRKQERKKETTKRGA